MPTFIYYANETAQGDEYGRFLRWLRESEDAEYRALADRAEEDLALFPRAVAVEMAAQEAARVPDDLAIVRFTNADARAGRLTYRPVGGARFAPVPFLTPTFDDAAFRLHPLSHPDAFAAALATAGRLTGQGEVCLVTKSHGNEKRCLTALFSALLDEEDRDTAMAALDRTFKAMPAAARARYCTRRASGDRSSLGPDFLGTNYLRELLNGVGTTKEEYLRALAAVSFELGVVLVEACDGRFTDAQLSAGPRNVRFFTSADEAKYTSVDYGVVLSQAVAGATFADALAEALAREFDEQPT